MSGAADEPDFITDFLTEFFVALRLLDKTDKYTEPDTVNVKLGFYVAYDIVKADAAALKRAADETQQAKAAEAKKPAADQKPVKKSTPLLTTRTEAKTAVNVKIPTGSKSLTISMKYVVRFVDAVLTTNTSGDWDLDDYIQRRHTAVTKYLHLTSTRTMGDAVHDDGNELARCNFQWHDALAKQSESGRKNFGKNLKSISFVPTAMGAADSMISVRDANHTEAYWSTVGMEFKKALATTCTYDGQGDYFNKWSADGLKAKHRSYIGPHLHEHYLGRATAEYQLEQGFYYALLTSPVLQRLYRIRPTKGGSTVELDLLISLDESRLIPPAWDTKYEALPKPDLLVFYATHGLKHGNAGKQGLKMPSYYRYDVKDGAHRRLADCQREVTADIGEDAAKKLRARSDFDWFVELAKLRFTDDLYLIDISKAMAISRQSSTNKLAFLPQLRKKSRDDLAVPMWEWAGTNQIRLAILEPTRALLDDETKLVLQQGMTVSEDVKFAGIHDGWAYVRDLKRDVTLKMPVDALVEEMALQQKYLTFYKNSEGMIYISQIIVWGGLAVMGVALVPGVLAARTVYRVAAQRVRQYGMDRAGQQILIKELPALAAGLAGIIARLFEGDYPEATQWKAFAKGFFKGYAVNTLKKIFLEFDAENVAKAVLREYYLYKRLKKLHQAVKKLSEKFNELSSKLDKKTMEVFVTKFEDAAGRSLQSALMLFQLISYLEKSDAEDILSGLSSALSDDPIETLRANEWYAEAKEGIMDSVEAVGKLVNGKGKAVFEAVDGAFTWVDEHEDIMALGALALTVKRIAKTMAELKTSKKTKTSPKKIIVVTLALIGGGVVLDVATDGRSTELLGDVGKSIKQSIPGKTPEDAEHRGEIYGHALGALFFDHGLIGSKSALGRVAKHDKIAKRLRKEAKHGILLPLLSVVLQRYVIFYRKALGYNGSDGDVAELFKDLRNWRTQSKEAQKFAKFQTTETGANLYDVMSAVLHMDEFLDKEVRVRWSAKWGSKAESYVQDLAAFREDAKTLGLEDLIKNHAPVMGHAMLTHLRAVIGNMKRTFLAMTEEVTLPDGSKLSLLGLLEMLGFDLKDLEAAVQEFDDHMAKTAQNLKAK